MRNLICSGALVCTLVLIAGCAGEESSSAETSVAADVTTSSPATQPTTTQASTTTSQAPTTTQSSTTTAGSDAAGGGESCIVGTWDIDTQGFIDQVFADAGAEMPPMLESAVAEGEYTLEFSADGTYRSVQDQLTIESDTPAGALVVTVDADQQGDWSVSGDQLTLEAATGDIDVSAQMEVNGQTMEVPFDVSEMFDGRAMAGTSTYTCAADELTVTFQGYTQTLHRIG